MKARVKETLGNSLKENEMIDIINISFIDIHRESLYVFYIKNNKMDFSVFELGELNYYLEFNYEEEKSNDVWITENECNRRIAECCKKRDEEIEYWKNKFMKLIDKI